MRDRRDIRARRAEGGTIRGIARDIGADRNTIRRALDPAARLDYKRPTLADTFGDAVRDVVADYPRLTVQQVAEVIQWPASRRTLSSLVADARRVVIDRQRAELIAPRVGTMASRVIRMGSITAGPITSGPLRMGRINGAQEAARGPRRPA